MSGGVGIALNALLFLGKLLSGLATGSIAVVADAFNNLSDAASSVITLVGLPAAVQDADQRAPLRPTDGWSTSPVWWWPWPSF